MLAFVVATPGCGGANSAPAVLHVGTVAIDKTAVDHWTRAIALGSKVPAALGRAGGTFRQKALGFLISANWAIGAAAERGLAVSSTEVQRGLQQRIEAVSGGRSEFLEETAATGQTLADVKFEVNAGLAVARLRKSLSASVAPVTRSQIADYYRHHLQSFRTPDRRRVDLIEELHGYRHAVALSIELGSGTRFAKHAMHELVRRETPYEDAHHDWKAPLLRAIFAAVPGRVARPASFHYRWVLLVVRKVIPSSVKPLSKVSAQISERLSEERHARALASFVQAYSREWTAKTSCDTGYLVQKCAGYRGPLVAEGNLLASG